MLSDEYWCGLVLALFTSCSLVVGQEALILKMNMVALLDICSEIYLCPGSACEKQACVAFVISRLGKDISLLTTPSKSRPVYLLKCSSVDFRLKPDPSVCYLYDTVFSLIKMVLLGCCLGLCSSARNFN